MKILRLDYFIALKYFVHLQTVAHMNQWSIPFRNWQLQKDN